jgi:hypothetical protein
VRRRLIVSICVILAGACAPRPPRSAAPRPADAVVERDGVRWYGDSFIRTRDGILEARFAGAPYERGYAHGRLAYAQIAGGEQDLDLLMHEMVPSGFRRWTLRELLALSIDRSEEAIGADHLQQIRGVADAEVPDPLPGGWSPYARQLMLHALHDFSQRYFDDPLSGACSGFAADGSATADGHVYLARSFDFEAARASIARRSSRRSSPEGWRFLTVNFGS